ncbi:MAG: sugar phosphate isomerase/epimerase [Clostridiales bacterium]|nr:sugar phosphate isomerase/epimerase [Clostridiales bacterium]
MKIAIDTFSYYMHFGKHWFSPENPVDIKWYCNTSKQLGAEGLHIDPYHIDLEKDAGWVRDFAKENGMYVELGACGTSIEELEPSIEAAELLGAKLLRTFVGGDCLDGRTATAKRAALAKKQLKSVLPVAESHGVKIAVENHGDIYIEDMLFILGLESEYLGVCYDSGNFAFTGENPIEGINAFGKKILCTHLKDVCHANKYPDAKPFITVKSPVHFCALGDGYLPINDIVGGLAELGIQNITLEICSPCDKSLQESELLAFEENNVKKSILYLTKNYSRI